MYACVNMGLSVINDIIYMLVFIFVCLCMHVLVWDDTRNFKAPCENWNVDKTSKFVIYRKLHDIVI